MLVLEGSLRLSVNRTFGDSVLLQAGRMVTMRPDAKRIPEPVTVDLRRIMKTSSLVKMAGKGERDLPSARLIDKEIAQQDDERAKGRLTEANPCGLASNQREVWAPANLDRVDQRKPALPLSRPTFSTRR